MDIERTLRQEINRLNGDLEIAHSRIESLQNEVNRLKRQIALCAMCQERARLERV
jgi:polyhydroxyalkanoate synthesis regulator phasin